jgi:hypothetical protein
MVTHTMDLADQCIRVEEEAEVEVVGEEEAEAEVVGEDEMMAMIGAEAEVRDVEALVVAEEDGMAEEEIAVEAGGRYY